MLMTNEKIPTDLDRRIARIGEQLAAPKKPARLQAADNTALVARRIHAVAEQEYRTVCKKRFELAEISRGSLAGEARAAEASAAQKKEAAEAARRIQELERAAFTPKYLEQIGPAAEAAKAVLIELVERLDDMATLLRDAHNFATMNGLEMPRVVTRAPQVQAYARQFKELLA